MPDSPLVSSIERFLLAEFLLFPGVLQSVANPCNYNQDFITQKYEICHTSAKLSPQAHFLLPLIAPVNLPLILLSPFSQALKQMFPFFISSLSKSTISYQGEKLPSLLRGEPFLCLALPHLLPLPPGCQGFRFLPGLSHSSIILTLDFYKGWFSLTAGEFLQGFLGIV